MRRAQRTQPRRIGIFGGTFNPIHLGHLRAAEEVAESEGLDRVLFIPSATPPHKREHSLAPAKHRLEMVRRGIAGNRRFRASALEIERRGRSYSVDTLRALQRQLGKDTQLYFILGLDAFLELDTWKEYEAVIALANLVVTSRPPRDEPRVSKSLLPVAVRRNFCYRARERGFVHRTGRKILLRRVTALDISASDIRRRLAEGLSVRYLVPREVERYIARHHLYFSRTQPV